MGETTTAVQPEQETDLKGWYEPRSSQKVWGTLRLTCGCWWGWQAEDQADYLFPRDAYECSNVDDGQEEPHGAQEIVTVRMHSHDRWTEQRLLRAQKKGAVLRVGSREERRQRHEELLAAEAQARDARLQELVELLAKGESPDISRKDRRRLRAAGLKI